MKERAPSEGNVGDGGPSFKVHKSSLLSGALQDLEKFGDLIGVVDLSVVS